jgi:hypothetical protein
VEKKEIRRERERIVPDSPSRQVIGVCLKRWNALLYRVFPVAFLNNCKLGERERARMRK